MYNYSVYPIGYVRKNKNESFIEILPDFILGMYRLDMISHIFVLWWIHQNDNLEARKTKIVIPRVINSPCPPEEMGTLATRSPRRPNPIGLTLAKIIGIDKNKIIIDHIDAFDGTPVLDIKPYLPNGDRVDDQIALPPWFGHLLTSRPSIKLNSVK